jgi:hypothetical protein
MKITELIVNSKNIDHLSKRIKYASILCKSLGSVPLVYRGFQNNSPSKEILVKVTNIEDDGSVRARKNVKSLGSGIIQHKILSGLNLTSPVFASMSTHRTSAHGHQYIFIPAPNSPVYWSPNVADLGLGQVNISDTTTYPSKNAELKGRVQLILSTYIQEWPKEFTPNELIFDCEYYYLLDTTKIAPGITFNNYQDVSLYLDKYLNNN